MNLHNVVMDVCEYRDVGGTDWKELERCRAACSADVSCFAIQWHEGDNWCDKCKGDSGVLADWGQTSGDTTVQSKMCWESGHGERLRVQFLLISDAFSRLLSPIIFLFLCAFACSIA